MRLPAQLLQRKVNSHKGDFGHILVIAGSPRYCGAAVLCGHAAIRSGAGLVTLGIPRGLHNSVIKIKPRELMTLPLKETKSGTISTDAFKDIKNFSQKTDVLVIGPGLAQDKSTQVLARKVISGIKKPMVIDADALNALAGHLNILLRSPYSVLCTRILTPHPGEMARLLGKTIEEVQEGRKEVAKKFAADYNLTLVLKGHHTIVADGAGKLYANKTGNPGMATAGTGDVLSGIIASFLGQGLSAFEAAKFAVYLHGLAGDLAAKEKTQTGMIASDIIEKFPEAMKTSIKSKLLA